MSFSGCLKNGELCDLLLLGGSFKEYPAKEAAEEPWSRMTGAKLAPLQLLGTGSSAVSGALSSEET